MKRLPLCLLMLLAVMLIAVPAPAAAQDTADGEQLSRAEQARVDRLWSRAWREFAPYYLQHGDEYIQVPGYSRSLPSSKGVSTRDYRKKNPHEQEYTDERGKKQKRTITKPEEEADAAVKTLQRVAVGQYGYIHSGKIDQIADSKTLVLEEIWLIDASAAREAKEKMKTELRERVAKDIEEALVDRGRDLRRSRGDGIVARRAAENKLIDWAFEDRLAAASRQSAGEFSRYEWTVVGYRTDKLIEDKRWPIGKAAERGLQLVIVEVKGSKVTAVPAATIGRGLSEQKFMGMLIKKGFTQKQFVDLVSDAKRASRTGYVDLVLPVLEGAKPDFERAAAEQDKQDNPGDPNGTVELAD